MITINDGIFTFQNHPEHDTTYTVPAFQAYRCPACSTIIVGSVIHEKIPTKLRDPDSSGLDFSKFRSANPFWQSGASKNHFPLYQSMQSVFDGTVIETFVDTKHMTRPEADAKYNNCVYSRAFWSEPNSRLEGAQRILNNLLNFFAESYYLRRDLNRIACLRNAMEQPNAGPLLDIIWQKVTGSCPAIPDLCGGTEGQRLFLMSRDVFNGYNVHNLLLDWIKAIPPLEDTLV